MKMEWLIKTVKEIVPGFRMWEYKLNEKCFELYEKSNAVMYLFHDDEYGNHSNKIQVWITRNNNDVFEYYEAKSFRDGIFFMVSSIAKDVKTNA